MELSDEQLEKLAEKLFKKLIKEQEKYEKNNHLYILSDEFGNTSEVSESAYYMYELDKLKDLEKEYVRQEKYEEADAIKRKITELKIKLRGIR